MTRGQRQPEPEEVERALERAARLERELIAETSGPPTPGELQAVEGALRRLSSSAPPASPRRRWLVWAGLAAAALLLFLFLRRDEGPAEPARTVLGNAEVEILEPVGALPAGAEFERIRWRTSSLGTPTFEVRVFDDESDLPLLPSTILRAFELSLDNLDTRAWKRIRIEVDELQPGGELEKSGRARAWRSR